MLKKRDLHECHSLFDLMSDPAVFPYVRYRCSSYEEYLFATKKLMDEEQQERCISRTILDELGHPIGTIDLYDIIHQTGFMATWIGVPYFGKGYNARAKEFFLTELFMEHKIETVFLKIRKQNIRSMRAVEKLSYLKLANHLNEPLFNKINASQVAYDLYQVEKAEFLARCDVMQQGVAT